MSEAQLKVDTTVTEKDAEAIRKILEADLKDIAKVKARVLKLLSLHQHARDSSAALINEYEAAYGYSKSHESITRAARYWQNTMGVFPCSEQASTRRKQRESAHEESYMSSSLVGGES